MMAGKLFYKIGKKKENKAKKKGEHFVVMTPP